MLLIQTQAECSPANIRGALVMMWQMWVSRLPSSSIPVWLDGAAATSKLAIRDLS